MGSDITTPGGVISQQFGMANIHIEKLISLNIGLKDSTQSKLVEILHLLKQNTDVSSNHKDVLIQVIEACKCKEYSYTRFSPLYERKVTKNSHTKD